VSRIRGTYIGKPGHNSELGSENISDESDWHDVFQKRMEAAGWSLKHEVVRNDGSERADFIGYHNKLNRSYESGEWIGFELKYSDYEHSTRAGQIGRQIEKKYLNGSWLSSGEDIGMWVVAPFVEKSHTGDSREMIATRNRELEASNILCRMGFGYLNSWHPTPHISFGEYGGGGDAFPRFKEWVNTPGLPAFTGVFDPWNHSRVTGYEAEQAADECRVMQSGDSSFGFDRDAMSEVADKYSGGVDDE